MTKTIDVNCAICNKKMKVPEDNMLYYNLDLEVDSICSDKCKVKYLDYNGKEKILEAEGLLATCIQHEIDHLKGILFIDYLSKLKKTMIVKKLSKQKKSIERIVV